VRVAPIFVLVVCLAVYPPFRLAAQTDSAVADTNHRMRPGAAFWRSLVIPGWGQSATGRHVTGAAFITWEGITAMMTLKAQGEAEYLKSIGSGHVKGKRQEVQDWLVLWVFNHLFAGAEAYVSAHLQDFPTDLHVRAFPSGIGVSLPLGHR
jgi:hypothetical protein